VYTLLPFLVIIIAFWFLLIRPQQKRQRKIRELQSQLSVGEKVMLTSGIYAEVRGVGDDYVLVEIADGVTVKVARAAIGQVLPTDTADAQVVDATAVNLDKPTEHNEAGGAEPRVSETPEQTLERLRNGENE
jgi:preprotein translocase subunit YajC